MPNLPHFEPSAYAPSVLETCDLDRLAKVADLVAEYLRLAEVASRNLRMRQAEPGRISPPEADQRNIEIANFHLSEVRRVHRVVRSHFALRLRRECGLKGHLKDGVVYYAQADSLGVGRIELANPPTLTQESIR